MNFSTFARRLILASASLAVLAGPVAGGPFRLPVSEIQSGMESYEHGIDSFTGSDTLIVLSNSSNTEQTGAATVLTGYQGRCYGFWLSYKGATTLSVAMYPKRRLSPSFVSTDAGSATSPVWWHTKGSNQILNDTFVSGWVWIPNGADRLVLNNESATAATSVNLHLVVGK